MKVKNIDSNMTEVHVGKAVVLVSYETPVAANIDGYLVRTEKFWSKTTSRHINKWLGGCTAEVVPQSKIEQIANTGGACLR